MVMFRMSLVGQDSFLLSGFGQLGRAGFGPKAVVAGLPYLAVVGQPIEESGGHRGPSDDGDQR